MHKVDPKYQVEEFVPERQYLIQSADPIITKNTITFNFLQHSNLLVIMSHYPLTNETVESIVWFSFWTIHHVPMIANQHSLLKESRIRTKIIVLSSLLITHMINLTISLNICVIACRSSTAWETCLWYNSTLYCFRCRLNSKMKRVKTHQ